VGSVGLAVTTRRHLRPLVVLALLAGLLVPLTGGTAGAAGATSGPDTLSVDRLYAAYFGRAPDPDGLAYWNEQRDRRTPLVAISAAFARSAEFVARYGSLDDAAFVELVYANVLHRRPDPAGLRHWTGQLAAGRTRGWVMLGFSDSAELKVRTGLIGAPYVPRVAALPRGGTTLFPAYRLVGEYGHPGIPAMGILGAGGPAEAARRVQLRALDHERRDGRPTLPTFEVIATVAQRAPGADGSYSTGIPVSAIRPWLDAVRSVDGYLVIDLQPGRDRFIDQARRYEALLVEPDVGLALDPEWSMAPGQVPGQVIGSTTAAEINAVSAYLAHLVAREGLPEKALVVHRFTSGMVVDPQNVVDRPGVAIVFHADGFGSPAAKLADYADLLPARFARGIKVFLRQDTRVLSPAELIGLRPTPDVITYQ